MRAPTVTARLRANATLPLLAALLALAGCGSVPLQTPAPKTPAAAPAKPAPRAEPGVPVLPPAGSGRGGYYQDDGPGENPPPNLADVADAEVKLEPLLPRSNRPYVVFGKTYTPITGNQPFTQRGMGTWYGKKFHGQRTSSGELYDMYKMTAAHPTLPIPSYARVTNISSGKQVVVRINDRGPFHSSRVIDVSYTAALKLGLLSKGSHELQVERLLPADIERMIAARAAGKPEQETAPLAQAAAAPAPGGPVMPPAPVELAAAGTPAAAVAAAAVAAMPAAAASGFYLQLGAYSRAENAEAVRARLAAASALLGLEVVQSGALHRLFSGPFGSRQEAADAALALPAALSLRPIVIQR